MNTSRQDRQDRSNDVEYLRSQRRQLDEDIADMTQTVNRMAADRGWDDPEVQRLDRDIDDWTARLARLSERIRAARAASVRQTA